MNANLEAWADNIGTRLTSNILGAVNPEVIKQRTAIQNLDIQANAMKKKFDSFFRFYGFKEWLFWISVLCNIGIAGYLIYTLIDWSVIVG